MPYLSTSTVTITREGGKLVVVRKPVLETPKTPREKFFGCFLPILIVVCFVIFSLAMSFNHIYSTEGKEAAYAFLIVITGIPTAILFSVTILVVRDKLKRQTINHPPDYDHEILTFGVDKFVVKYRGMTFAFSYRQDARPLLRQSPHSTWPKYVDVVIPCTPLGDIVPADFHWGHYEMPSVEIINAKRIPTALIVLDLKNKRIR